MRVFAADEIALSQAAGLRFSLLRTFSLVSLVLITSMAVLIGMIAARFMENQSIERDAMLTAQFIHAIAETEIRHGDSHPGVSMGEIVAAMPTDDAVDPPGHERLRNEFLDHIENLPDALHANIYSTDRRIVWSTNGDLIGLLDKDNEELEQAIATGTRVTEAHSEVQNGRAEQQFKRPLNQFFIETYIPLLGADGSTVAVVEVYKEPVDLNDRIKHGHRQIWIGSAGAGLLLYSGLFWIVHDASRRLDRQQQQLLDAEKFVAMGELSSAVAHSLRNPLAVIRSSAELALEAEPALARAKIGEIIGQVDRMSQWVRDFLTSTRPLNGASETVDLTAVIHQALSSFEHAILKSGAQVAVDAPESAAVVGQKALFLQVFASLIANSLEAMPEGGRLAIQVTPGESIVRVEIADSGKGMSPEQEAMAFKQFYTTKREGLGAGLPLVKRAVERFGGRVGLTGKNPMGGATVSLEFAVVEENKNEKKHSGRRG